MCRILKLAALAAAVTLAGCASLPPGLQGFMPNSPNTYAPGQSQNAEQVHLGTVLAVHRVEIQPSTANRAVSSGIGAAVGGLVGHQVGGGNGKTAATVVGAIGGAVAGNLVGGHMYRQPGLQITVKLDGDAYGNGREVVNVTQAADVHISVGERVQVIGSSYSGQPVRVEPLN